MIPKFETPAGLVNGVNRDFLVTSDFKAGSVRVFLNGLLNRRDLVDGWKEFPPRRVRLNSAPRTGDVIQIYYLPIP